MSQTAASAIHQNLTHGLGGDNKKMGTVIKIVRSATNQFYTSFVNKGGGLKRVGFFRTKLTAGKAA